MGVNGSKGEVRIGEDERFDGASFDVYDEGEYTPIGSREDIWRSTEQGDLRVSWDDEKTVWYQDELLMNCELSVWPSSAGHSSCWMYAGKSFDVTGNGNQTADVTVDLHHRTELFNAGYASGSADGELLIRKTWGGDESSTGLWSEGLGSLGIGTTKVEEEGISKRLDYNFEAGNTYEVIVKIKQSASAGFFGGSTIDQGVKGDGGYGYKAPAQAVAVSDIEIDWR